MKRQKFITWEELQSQENFRKYFILPEQVPVKSLLKTTNAVFANLSEHGDTLSGETKTWKFTIKIVKKNNNLERIEHIYSRDKLISFNHQLFSNNVFVVMLNIYDGQISRHFNYKIHSELETEEKNVDRILDAYPELTPNSNWESKMDFFDLNKSTWILPS